MILWSIQGQKQIINYMFNLSFNRNNINDSLNSEFFHFIQNNSHSYYASEFNNFEHINRIRNVHFDYNCFTSVIWLYSLYTFLAYDILYRLSFSVKILIWIRKQMINCYRTRKKLIDNYHYCIRIHDNHIISYFCKFASIKITFQC